ncbi:hypothetical protein [Scleromatobacter humisilvae]|uniref:Peptidase MA-like domain-containing protein n=1 Tax=Scleromatobacter humisilvae TaxID=2897159 RepID=A0A9X2BYZ2_9BURK|nr:hypothetical protein [Scleromatobacter humisilvae]MCK9686118.1 hypothetical protein [Scleromatobacter humisilvae]
MAARIASVLAFSALLLASHAAPAAADLTDTERRWLAGATPPVAWALKQGLPIDIVVLPQAEAGAAPIAMGYDEGRCKLVFAMRGNPAAESTLAAIPPPLLQATLEAMAAHEIGHCQRHRSGAFNSLPSGLADKPDAIENRQPTVELQAIAREMRITRREEAYADLVGLAWTHAHHADQYAQVLAWFDQARSDETPRGFHDTRHWLALAHAADAFTGTAGPFDEADAMWQRGLLDD